MTLTRRGFSDAGRQTGGTTLAIPETTGVQDGDIQFVGVHTIGEPTLGAPAGYTQLYATLSGALFLGVYYRVMDGTQDGTADVTTAGSTNWAYTTAAFQTDVSSPAYAAGADISDDAQVVPEGDVQLITEATTLTGADRGVIFFGTLQATGGAGEVSSWATVGGNPLGTGTSLGFSTSFRRGAAVYTWLEADGGTVNNFDDFSVNASTAPAGAVEVDYLWYVLEFSLVAGVAIDEPSGGSKSVKPKAVKVLVKELPYAISADMLGSPMLSRGRDEG